MIINGATAAFGDFECLAGMDVEEDGGGLLKGSILAFSSGN
jgi:hypothetical protein